MARYDPFEDSGDEQSSTDAPMKQKDKTLTQKLTTNASKTNPADANSFEVRRSIV